MQRPQRQRTERSVTLHSRFFGRAQAEKLGAPATPEELEAHARTARPRTRGECAGGSRPCPFVACEHHLYLDVNPDTGSIKLNFPDLEVDELEHSCSLDLADEGMQTLEMVGVVMNLTRERVRQIEARGQRRLHRAALAAGLEGGE